MEANLTPDFIYINSSEDYDLHLDLLTDYTDRLAIDTETYTKDKYRTFDYASAKLRTNPHTGDVSLLSVALDPNVKATTYVFDVICLKALGCDFKKLAALLKRARYLIAHNAKFDLAMLSTLLGKFENVACTYTLANLYANATGSKLWQTRGMDLGSCCRDWLGVELKGKGTTQIGEWYSDPPSRRLDNPNWFVKLSYAADDVKHLFSLHDIFRYMLDMPLPNTPLISSGSNASGWGLGMAPAVSLESALTPIVASMEITGLPYDDRIGKAFAASVDNELLKSGVKLCQMLDLPLTTQGLWGDLVPDPTSLKLLNNPKALVSTIESKCGISLPKAQNALFERLVNLLNALGSKQEDDETSSDTEILDTELDVYRQLEDLSTELISLGIEVCGEIVRYKKLLKQQGMILSDFVNPESGRIHPNYQPLRAATGRFSVNSPNIQQVSARLELPIELPAEVIYSLVNVKLPEPNDDGSETKV